MQSSTFDTSRARTWAIKTTDGRTFQLREIGLSGQTERSDQPNLYAGAAGLMDFIKTHDTELGKRYRVTLTYRDVMHAQTIAGQLLASAVNNTVQNNLPSSLSMEIFRIAGKNLDGDPWCLSSRANTIDTIRWIE